MNADDFIEILIQKARQYTTMNGIEVVDGNGNKIQNIIFDIKNGKIIIS